MACMAVHVRGSPEDSSPRTSASRPSRAIWSTRRSMRAHRSARSRKVRPMVSAWADRMTPAPPSTRASSSSMAAPPRRASSASSSPRRGLSGEKAAKVRPESRESIYSPVPPATMGSLPRARIPSTQAEAISTYRAAEKSSPGSATSIMWCGIPSISSAVGLAMPMSMRR